MQLAVLVGTGTLEAIAGIKAPRVTGIRRVLRTKPVVVGLHILETACVGQAISGLGIITVGIAVRFVTHGAEKQVGHFAGTGR